MTDLFTLCHKSDPQTSFDAAEKMVKSGKLNRQEKEVFDAIILYFDFSDNRLSKDFTAKDICKVENYYKIQRRLSGLHNKGKIERIQATDKGELLFNKKGKPIYNTRDGCCVWRLKGK